MNQLKSCNICDSWVFQQSGAPKKLELINSRKRCKLSRDYFCFCNNENVWIAELWYSWNCQLTAFLLSWQDDLMKSFVTQWFQEELLSECRAERERGNMNTLETLLDYATEQFVEHSIFSCINMTTLRLTRYLTKKKPPTKTKSEMHKT